LGIWERHKRAADAVNRAGAAAAGGAKDAAVAVARTVPFVDAAQKLADGDIGGAMRSATIDVAITGATLAAGIAGRGRLSLLTRRGTAAAAGGATAGAAAAAGAGVAGQGGKGPKGGRR